MPIDVPSHVVGLIGRGIGQSRSPRIHEAESAACGFPLAYRLVDFSALGRGDDELESIVRLFAGLGFSGCNVTFPFKQSAMSLCDSRSDAAEVLGAVNTLVFRDGRIHGENTDWLGFSWLIEREIGSVAGMVVAQIGAGGAGSATAYALARLGVAKVKLFDPEMDRASQLASRLAPHFPHCRFEVQTSPEVALSAAEGVVNATPVGMANIPGTPFDPSVMNAAQWLADIIYFPLETELLGAARSQGQKVVNGISMVVGQAAEAFRLITGYEPNRDRMLARLQAEIAAERQPESVG